MVISEWVQAHDLHPAVGLDGQIGLNAERNVEVRWVPGVDAQVFDATYFWPARIANCRARLEASRKREVSVVRPGGSGE